MFIIEDKLGKRIAEFEESFAILASLFKDNEAGEAKFPMWSCIDSTSPTVFGNSNMQQLISDLELLKSPAELESLRQQWEQNISSTGSNDLNNDVLIPFIDQIIQLAQRCQELEGSILIHGAFK